MKTILKYSKNMYVLSGIIFLVWMSFFDANSWFFTHRELSHDIRQLNRQRTFLINQIAKDQQMLKSLMKSENLERYARETYFLNTSEEETYIIDYDDGK